MNIISRAVAALLPFLLAACLSQTSAPSTAPRNFTVTPGESRVTLDWTSEPGLTYWVYYKEGNTVSKDDFTSIHYKVTAPAVIGNLTNGTLYAFLVTASDDNSKTGPASSVETATPRLVGATSTWTEGAPLFTNNNLNGITLGNNIFVAVGDAATVFTAEHNYTSPGGVTVPATGTVNGWSAATTLPGGYSADLSAVIYDGARFVALGRTDGSIIISTDAATWTAGISTGIANMNDLAYGGGTTYVAVGNDGAIYKNTTAGVTDAWTVKPSGTTNNLYGVSYVNGMFVAVGAGGVLLTSTDGDTWTLRTSNTSNDLHEVAFGASTYVAVGDAGTIVSSADAATWAVQTNPTVPATESLRTICFGPDAQFIAAGTAGTIVYSTTGLATSWSAANAGSSALNSIVPSDVFIAVGAGGAYVSGK